MEGELGARDLAVYDGQLALALEVQSIVESYPLRAPFAPIATVRLPPGPRALAVVGEELAAACTNGQRLALTNGLTVTTSAATTRPPLHVASAGDHLAVLVGLRPEEVAVELWTRTASLARGRVVAMPNASALSFVGDTVVALEPGAIHPLDGEALPACAEPFRAVGADLGAGPRAIVACRDGGLDVLGLDGARAHLEGGEALYDVVAADLDGDAQIDVAAVDLGAHQLVLWWGLGGGKLSAPATYPVGQGPTALDAADVDGDGDVDLIVLTLEARGFDVMMNGRNE